MRHRSIPTLLAIGLALGTLEAGAADLIEAPVAAPIEEAYGGWYIRGDAGYTLESKTDGDSKFWNQGYDRYGNFDASVQGVDEIVHYDSIKFEGAGSIGVGAGYRFSDQFRADVTLDRFRTDVDGKSDCDYLVEYGYDINPVNSGCTYKDKSKATVWTAMANAYVDLAHLGPVTPYVGAGAGLAFVDYDDMSREIYCGLQSGCKHVHGYKSAELPVYSDTHDGAATWRFAASLMAGASIDITHNLKLDAGYRYTRIAKGDAFDYDKADKSFNAEGVQLRDHGFDVHALRAGVRYEFN